MMFRKLKNNYPIHLIIAFVLICTGLDLWNSRKYFFWPPLWVNFLNDDVVGFLGVVIGCLIVYWTYDNNRGKKEGSFLLSLSSVWVGTLTMVELGHVIFADFPRMIGDVTTDIAILMLIMYCAKKS